MPLNSASDRITSERDILRALCVRELSSNERTRALASLASCRFQDAHNQILFDVLREIPQATPAMLRERLPALLTRRGFPDFDVDFFLSTKQFPGHDLLPEELLVAIGSLDGNVKDDLEPARAKQIGTPLRGRVALFEVLAFSLFVGVFIWRLQFTHRLSWIVFVVWIAASFVLYRDTPKTLGWRADNLWPATRRAVIVLGALSLAVLIVGIFLGAAHRLPVISLDRWWNYFAFCLLQEVALQSFLTNRLLIFFGEPCIDTKRAGRWKAALVAGVIFGVMHWPNPVLAPATFVGGAIMAWLFARERNIIPLAIGQAILGMLVWWAFPMTWHHGMRVGPGFYTFGR